MKFIALALLSFASPAWAGSVALEWTAVPASNGAESYCVYYTDTQGEYRDPAQWGFVQVPTSACADDDGDGVATCRYQTDTLPDLADSGGNLLRSLYMVVKPKNIAGEGAPSNEVRALVQPPQSVNDLRQVSVVVNVTMLDGTLARGELAMLAVRIP